MKRYLVAAMNAMLLTVFTEMALAATATYSDFSGYTIRNGAKDGYTTGFTSDNDAETFTVTAVGGGKVAIGTSDVNGLKVSDFVNLKFSNSVAVETASKMAYMNFWVTNNAGNYAFVAVNSINGTTQDDFPVYQAMTSGGGMSESYFENLAVRVYATNTSNLNWLYNGCVQQSKAGSWSQSLWKSSTANIMDPVLVSDLGNLYFGSPFTTATVPGVSTNNNPEWPYANTGDPQTPDSFYLMCGDTSGSVQNYPPYTLSGIQLTYVPEPGTLALLSLAGFGLLAYAWRRRAKA